MSLKFVCTRESTRFENMHKYLPAHWSHTAFPGRQQQVRILQEWSLVSTNKITVSRYTSPISISLHVYRYKVSKKLRTPFLPTLTRLNDVVRFHFISKTDTFRNPYELTDLLNRERERIHNTPSNKGWRRGWEWDKKWDKNRNEKKEASRWDYIFTPWEGAVNSHHWLSVHILCDTPCPTNSPSTNRQEYPSFDYVRLFWKRLWFN